MQFIYGDRKNTYQNSELFFLSVFVVVHSFLLRLAEYRRMRLQRMQVYSDSEVG